MKGLATPPEAAVQYYNVVCPMGHRVRGQRTEGYQALRCPACPEGVFVLPASPLPDPGPRVAAVASRRAVEEFPTRRAVEEGPIELEDAGEATVDVAEARPAPEAEIPWEDEDVPVQTREAPDEPRGPTRRRPAPHEAPAPPRPAGRRERREAAAVVDYGGGPRPRKRGGRHPAWIFALVALVVVGTISLRLWRVHRQGLPQVAELGRVEGIPALESGDFDRAHQLLAPARQAVDALGGQVEDADRIRQAADEVALYVNLSSLGLEEMLDEAARSSSPDAWASQFGGAYKGRGIVFDTKIQAAPDGASKRYEIEYVVMPANDVSSFREGGARPERLARIDLRGFELFELAGPKVGDHVVFGGRLAAMEYDAVERGWVVRLEPRSGLFVQFHKALESLGWPEPEPAAGPEPGAEP